tara:strand:- start:64 stop:204 length:141 start_codon:yes stop_codon:yes gene_type:complete
MMKAVTQKKNIATLKWEKRRISGYHYVQKEQVNINRNLEKKYIILV